MFVHIDYTPDLRKSFIYVRNLSIIYTLYIQGDGRLYNLQDISNFTVGIVLSQGLVTRGLCGATIELDRLHKQIQAGVHSNDSKLCLA